MHPVQKQWWLSFEFPNRLCVEMLQLSSFARVQVLETILNEFVVGRVIECRTKEVAREISCQGGKASDCAFPIRRMPASAASDVIKPTLTLQEANALRGSKGHVPTHKWYCRTQKKMRPYDQVLDRLDIRDELPRDQCSIVRVSLRSSKLQVGKQDHAAHEWQWGVRSVRVQ